MKSTLDNPKEREALLQVLKTRFENNMNRHKDLSWSVAQKALEARPDTLRSLMEMEESGGEPDVVLIEDTSAMLAFIDCSAESPKGRRSICYDRQALDDRKEHKPATSAMDMAALMGIEVLTEAQYRKLQEYGEFDLKTSSWIQTPADIRKLGGALFADRRYGKVFVYHNGADSYYGARGFRGILKI